jgi:hypothetical protein
MLQLDVQFGVRDVVGGQREALCQHLLVHLPALACMRSHDLMDPIP